MKKLFNISLIFCILCLGFSNTHKNEFPNTSIQTNILKDIDACISSANHFIELIQTNKKLDFIQEYKNLRSDYKKIIGVKKLKYNKIYGRSVLTIKNITQI